MIGQLSRYFSYVVADQQLAYESLMVIIKYEIHVGVCQLCGVLVARQSKSFYYGYGDLIPNSNTACLGTPRHMHNYHFL